jgi:hypothetical protein
MEGIHNLLRHVYNVRNEKRSRYSRSAFRRLMKPTTTMKNKIMAAVAFEKRGTRKPRFVATMDTIVMIPKGRYISTRILDRLANVITAVKQSARKIF